MSWWRTGAVVAAIGAAVAVLLASDAATVGVTRLQTEGVGISRAAWSEVKWPFLLDQWGVGRAYRCSAADCGVDVTVYLRPKIGFCNCAEGVSDDGELDRVGDLELFSDKFVGLTDGREVKVGWMNGRSRPYHVTIPYATARDMLAIAFNDRCDVMVATVVAERDQIAAAERAALDFLNGDTVLGWAKAELGS